MFVTALHNIEGADRSLWGEKTIPGIWGLNGSEMTACRISALERELDQFCPDFVALLLNYITGLTLP